MSQSMCSRAACSPARVENRCGRVSTQYLRPVSPSDVSQKKHTFRQGRPVERPQSRSSSRLGAQAGELVAAGEQFRIRRANVKDLDDLANLCAEAFTESALEQYPAFLTEDAQAREYIETALNAATIREVTKGLTRSFSRKVEGQAEARQMATEQLKGLRASAAQKELAKMRAEGLDTRTLLSADEVQQMEQRLKGSMEKASMLLNTSKTHRKRQFLCLLAEDPTSGALLGSATLSLSVPDAALPPPLPTALPFKAYVSNMAVGPAYRRKGVACALLKECERTAARWRFEELWLHVDVGNDAAEALYRANGYTLFRQDPVWFGLPRRKVLNKILLKVTQAKKQ